MRTRSARVIPIALVAGLSLALPVASLTAQAATSGPPGVTADSASSSTVTLPTGDRVVVTGTGAKTRILVQPAAKSGPGRVLNTTRHGSEVSVTPVAAEPYLGRFLDRNLFDVTTLRAGLKANGHLPVRISYQGQSAPTVPGVTVTAAKSGVATGYLTASSAAGFGQALAAQWLTDSKADWPERSSLFGGVTKIKADLPGTGTATPKYPMYTLIVKAIGSNGKPMAAGEVDLLNVDNSQKYFGSAWIENGEARVSVPKGNYSAITTDYEFSETGETGSTRIVTAEKKVSRADQTLTVDLRKATVKPTVRTPRKATLTDSSFEWDRTDATGEGSFSSQFGLGPGVDLYLAPAKAPRIGTTNSILTWQLDGPGAKPAYTYNLAAVADGIPAKAAHVFTTSRLAPVTARYYGDGGATTGGTARTPVFPFQFFVFGTLQPVALGTKRIEYVGATGGTPVWSESALVNYESFEDPGFVSSSPRKIPAGKATSASWFKGPLAAGIPTQSSPGYCFACRTSSSLELSLAPFTDSVSTHFGSISGAADGLPVARFRFYKNNKLVSDEDDSLGGVFDVAAGKATYKGVLDVDRRLLDPNQSTRSHTELTFTSAKGKGGKLPSSWFCDLGPATSCAVLPILQAKLSLPVGRNGTLPAKKSTVTVTVDQIQHATSSPITSAGLEIRPPGYDWTPVKLKSAGGGTYLGVVDNAGLEGQFVDVRVRGADKAGSRVTQTVLRAYTVTAH